MFREGINCDIVLLTVLETNYLQFQLYNPQNDVVNVTEFILNNPILIWMYNRQLDSGNPVGCMTIDSL